MTTLDARVAADADDTWNFGTTWTNSTAPRAGESAGANYDASLRFTNVTIPSGATIDSAYLEVVCNLAQATTVRTNVFGEDADNPAAPTSSADFLGRTLTTEVVLWSTGNWALDSVNDSPDLAAVIQEIVDRGGWASGQAMQLFWKDDTGYTDTNYKRTYGYGNDPAKAALLHLVYTAGATGLKFRRTLAARIGSRQIARI
jgi:MSHA biogenesis protein MshQ